MVLAGMDNHRDDRPVMDVPYYVQFNVADLEVGLDPHGHSKGMTRPIGYWHVDDIKQTFAQLVGAGVQEQQAVTDLGGRFIATVKDADATSSD